MLSLQQKRYLFGTIILIIVLLGQIPMDIGGTTFFESVFRPIKMGGGQLYYLGFILMALIYMAIKSVVKPTARQKVLIVFVILLLVSEKTNWVEKLYRSAQSGAKAVGMHADLSRITYTNISDQEIALLGNFHLENYSEEPGTYYMTIQLKDRTNPYLDGQCIEVTDASGQRVKHVIPAKSKHFLSVPFKIQSKIPLENQELSGSLRGFDLLLEKVDEGAR